MAKSVPPKNIFHDINRFPPGWGKLFFPISLLKISTSQSPKEIIKTINFFTNSKKFSVPKTGADIVYADLLYINNQDRTAKEWKEYTMKTISKHRRELDKLLKKNSITIQVPQAIEFHAWAKLYLSYNGDFYSDFLQLKKIAAEDESFMKYLEADAAQFGRKLTKDQIDFFLEEHLLLTSYMTLHSKLYNLFTQEREQWFLLCYPGKPPKANIYLWQKNPFKFTSSDDNPYVGFYDYEDRLFYDFRNIDLDTYVFE